MAGRKPIQLETGEQIVCCWAEYASGPGWSNAPLWYVVRGAMGELRIECLQPHEQSVELLLLYPCLAAAHSSALKALEWSTCVKQAGKKVNAGVYDRHPSELQRGSRPGQSKG